MSIFNSVKKQLIKIVGSEGSDGTFDSRHAPNNPKYETFHNIQDDGEVVDESIIAGSYGDHFSGSQSVQIATYKNTVYGNLSKNKLRRVLYWRDMASYSQISNAIDEIADACINYDADGHLLNLILTNTTKDNLTSNEKETLVKEFERFISLYNFECQGFDYFRNVIIDGELTWENIIPEKDADIQQHGFIGVKLIPNETFEYLFDTRFVPQGIVINAKYLTGDSDNADSSYDVKKTDNYTNLGVWNNINLRQTRFDKIDEGQDIIPMPMAQITNVNSGILSRDKTYWLPVLEKARQAYRQLTLLEDAIIIYRLVRAPERLIFNIDTGRMSTHRAEQHVKKQMDRYQTKKIYDPVNGSTTNDYDPHQMMEAFWFPKPEGSSGSSVTTLQTGQNLGQLDDLKYFQGKLYEALQIPYNRHPMSGNSANTLDNNTSITYEEYRFSKFVIRIQTRFAMGLTEAFKSHLKLRGLWKKYGLNNRSFSIKFNPPAAYNLYTEQQLTKMRIDNYTNLTQDDWFSKELAAKKYLGMSEEDIIENHKRKNNEIKTQAYRERTQDNVLNDGYPENNPYPDEEEEL